MTKRISAPAVLAGVIGALGALGVFAAPPAAEAETYYPWCAQYRWPIDATNCGFVSYQQCMATISGIGGHCYQNPAYPPPRERTRRR